MPKDINQVIVEEGNIENPIKLSNPITIVGQQRDELPWDANAITSEQFLEAATKSRGSAAVMEQDYTFHLMLGFALITCANPDITILDLETQVSGPDVIMVAALGRFFIMRSEKSDQSNSEDASEATPESSTLQLVKSEDSDSLTSSSNTEKQPKTKSNE